MIFCFPSSTLISPCRGVQNSDLAGWVRGSSGCIYCRGAGTARSNGADGDALCSFVLRSLGSLAGSGCAGSGRWGRRATSDRVGVWPCGTETSAGGLAAWVIRLTTSSKGALLLSFSGHWPAAAMSIFGGFPVVLSPDQLMVLSLGFS